MLTGILSGVAGEYFVAAELSKRGYIASITLRNSKGVDVLCSNAEATRTVGIQVKTNQGNTATWILNQKSEGYYADNLFYSFVCLNNNQKPPDYFIVPSKTVARFVKESHQTWLSNPGRHGQAHKDCSMRHFRDDVRQFQNRWDLLGL